MSEELLINKKLSKKEQYEQLVPQVKALIGGEVNTLANQANLCAAIKETFDYLWVGFYHVIENELVLGTFQGPIACTRIKRGKGVCGTAWDKNEIIIVEDVSIFPGHISCSSSSKSEIVIPLTNTRNEVIAVLDIDHSELNTFGDIDAHYLQILVDLL